MDKTENQNWKTVLLNFAVQHNARIQNKDHFIAFGNLYNEPEPGKLKYDIRFTSVYLPRDADSDENQLAFCFRMPLFPSVVSRYYSGTNDHWSDYAHVAIDADSIESCEEGTDGIINFLRFNSKDGSSFSIVLEDI
ncbi:hypothetical protein SDC9_46654 [bioreactor metagenome]|uniref:Uncharacterized protein n=1 Tax=bioreactor metagenome TaxID=1076179 RepID=A0A644W9H0_9ZZZZ